MAIDGKQVFVRIASVFYSFDGGQRRILDLTRKEDREIYALSFVEPRCHSDFEWATVTRNNTLVIKHESGLFSATMDPNTRVFDPMTPLADSIAKKQAEMQIEEMRKASNEDAKLLGIDFLWIERPASTGNLSAHGSHAMAAGSR